MRILITTQGSLPSAINRNRLEVRKEIQVRLYWGPCYSFPDSSDGKECTHNGGDPGSIPGSGRSSGEGIGYPVQYSWASLVAQMVKNLPTMQETWVQSLGWEDSQEESMVTHFRTLAWRTPMDRGAWQTTVHVVPKSRTQLSD